MRGQILSRCSAKDPAMAKASDKPVKKVVLAYSGGLDTSIILKWLQTEYGAEVVTFTADLGQGEELAPAREKALKMGIKPENIFIDDLREEFVRDYVFPMFRANALYEGQYLLGTSIARPLIAKRQIEIARQVGADAVSHGSTGKGNDQVRYEVAYYALEPDIHVIAPWATASAPTSSAMRICSCAMSGRAMEVPSRYIPSYSALARNIGKTKSRTNSSRRSRTKMLSGLMPSNRALSRAGPSSSPWPRSAVKVTTSQP